jgi:hypothetical protein
MSARDIRRIVDLLVTALCATATVVAGISLGLTDLRSWTLGETPIGVLPGPWQVLAVALVTTGYLSLRKVWADVVAMRRRSR